MKKLFFLVALIIVSFACKKQKDHHELAAPPNPLFNTWEFVWYEDNQQFMIKTEQLPEARYGFIFEPDGRFIEMKNSDVCSTNGCFEYKIYEGTWDYLGDNTYHIHASYWGGEMDFNLQVISIKKDTLVYTIPYPPQ